MKQYFIYFFLFLIISIHNNLYSKQLQYMFPKNNHAILLPEFLQNMKSFFNPTFFIETGTYNGYTALNASRYFNVKTIELSHHIYQENFLRLSSVSHLEAYYGNSPEVLLRILPDIKTKNTLLA